LFKKLMVEGMSCQHCKHNIETVLKQMEGIKEATAYYNEGYVDINFDDSKVKIEEIMAEIEDLGFDVIK
jgi:copper chaperone